MPVSVQVAALQFDMDKAASERIEQALVDARQQNKQLGAATFHRWLTVGALFSRLTAASMGKLAVFHSLATHATVSTIASCGGSVNLTIQNLQQGHNAGSGTCCSPMSFDMHCGEPLTRWGHVYAVSRMLANLTLLGCRSFHALSA